jgi:phosphoribosylformylglycinamidine (FGAM) synthase-like enzyme
VAGAPPRCDLPAERALIEALLAAVRAGAVRSAHDVSDGGLAVAIAECCIGNAERLVGADVDLSAWGTLPLRALLFGEGQGRIVVSAADASVVLALAGEWGVPAREIGTVRPQSRELRIATGGTRLAVPLDRLAAAYHGAIPQAMGLAAVIQAAEEPSAAGSFV